MQLLIIIKYSADVTGVYMNVDVLKGVQNLVKLFLYFINNKENFLAVKFKLIVDTD